MTVFLTDDPLAVIVCNLCVGPMAFRVGADKNKTHTSVASLLMEPLSISSAPIGITFLHFYLRI